jgi:RNA polymerase sigma-70 factor (ECF subfamily)
VSTSTAAAGARPVWRYGTGEREESVTGHRFDDFYAANFNKLTVQLYAYVGDMTEAQDIVQEAFCRAWPRWDRIEHYEDPVAWVRRVAWNIARSRWRRLRTALSFAQRQRLETVPEPSPDRVAVSQALATLPEHHRRAVVLHHLAGLSVDEIAAECGVASGTVKSWLHRGRTAMARHFSENRQAGA